MTDYTTTRDTRIQATLAAIDEATVARCSTCTGTLPPDSPSPWYCSEACQTTWHATLADSRNSGLSRRVVCCGTPDRMELWLQWGDGPDQREAVADWLRANDIPVTDIPIDSTVTVEGGQITVDVYQRGENGGMLVDTYGHPERSSLTVPLVREWTPPAERLREMAAAAQRGDPLPEYDGPHPVGVVGTWVDEAHRFNRGGPVRPLDQWSITYRRPGSDPVTAHDHTHCQAHADYCYCRGVSCVTVRPVPDLARSTYDLAAMFRRLTGRTQ